MTYASSVLSSGVQLSIVIILAACGELISETGGVINIGLEGMMTVGAYVGYITMASTHDALLAAVVGALAGLLSAGLMIVSSVWLGANQILAGFALYILLPAAAAYLYTQDNLSTGITPGLANIKIPLLSSIPLIGGAFFDQNGFYFAAVAIALLSWILLTRTRYGLELAACGHDPEVAAAKGLHVRRARTIAVAICGALGGLAGVALTVGATGEFNPGIINGGGFVAIILVILGRWKLKWTVLFGLLIGVLEALQLKVPLGSHIPVQLLGALPWVVVLVSLPLGARSWAAGRGPRSLGADLPAGV